MNKNINICILRTIKTKLSIELFEWFDFVNSFRDLYYMLVSLKPSNNIRNGLFHDPPPPSGT